MSNVISMHRRKPAIEPEFMTEWSAYFLDEISKADLPVALRRADAHRDYLIRKRDEAVLDRVREAMGATA